MEDLFKRLNPTQRKERGLLGESLARDWLIQQGFLVIAANVRFAVGEIDLVAREANTLCFIEVRSRASDVWGDSFASVTDTKRRRLVRAAQWYLQRHGAWPGEIRFDVVGIAWQDDKHGKSNFRIECIRGAFSADI